MAIHFTYENNYWYGKNIVAFFSFIILYLIKIQDTLLYVIMTAVLIDNSCINRDTYALLGEGNGTPLQYSCLENPMDGGAWKAAVHGVAEGQTQLNDFTFTFHFHALEKEMATTSSVLAWRILGTGEPLGLLSVGLHRVGHD